MYVYGRNIKVQSDHKPLEIILKKSLVLAPKRLQRMMLRLQKYDLEVVYKKGEQMYMADTLSRAYLKEQGEEEAQEEVMTVCNRSEAEIEMEQVESIKNIPISDERLGELKKATEEDPEMKVLLTTVQQGWPESKRETPAIIHGYFNYRDEIVVQNGLIIKADRVIIPPALREATLKRIHSSHMGVDGSIRRVKRAVFWPSMGSHIAEYISQCGICRKMENTPIKEPLLSHEVPDRPWSKVGLDLFHVQEKTYLVTVDYYSNFWEIDMLKTTESQAVIKKIKAHFARYGIPDTVISDNGPQFSSHTFKEFADQWEFKHHTSSPYHSRSNGLAESAVKTAKRLITKAILDQQDIYLALLDHRNTPTQGFSSSPSQD